MFVLQTPWWWRDAIVLGQMQVVFSVAGVLFAILAIIYAWTVAKGQGLVIDKQLQLVEQQLKMAATHAAIDELQLALMNSKALREGQITMGVTSWRGYKHLVFITNETAGVVNNCIVNLTIKPDADAEVSVVETEPQLVFITKKVKLYDEVIIEARCEAVLKPGDRIFLVCIENAACKPVSGSVHWLCRSEFVNQTGSVNFPGTA